MREADCGAPPAKASASIPASASRTAHRPQVARAQPADGDNICDYVKVAGRWIAVECSDDLDDPVSEVGTILATPTARTLRRRDGVRRVEVDHRSRFVAPKDQGRRNVPPLA